MLCVEHKLEKEVVQSRRVPASDDEVQTWTLLSWFVGAGAVTWKSGSISREEAIHQG